MEETDKIWMNGELVDGVRQLHPEQARRVVQAAQVVGQSEDRGAAGGLVRADALEDAGAVVEPVRGDVHRRVAPGHEAAVHPDRLGLLHHCRKYSNATGSALFPTAS